jgi:hypothetical protein
MENYFIPFTYFRIYDGDRNFTKNKKIIIRFNFREILDNSFLIFENVTIEW